MTIMPPPNPTLLFPRMHRRNVAVIGAGAGGLAAARELRREGHSVVVFEREDQVGGTWIYTPSTESDPIGLDPSRTVVQSSIYASLRTNLPREVMGFRDYPFLTSNKPHRDPRRYPGHEEVLEYLKDYATEFGLSELVRFGIEVRYVGLTQGGKWIVKSGKKDGDKVDEIYDAVVVCNGHYTEPRIADIPGIDVWPGKQIHSHNYRAPEPFRGQVVILIGSAASAVDISRDVSRVAKEVHIASRSNSGGTSGKLPSYDNIWLHPMIESVHEEGTVIFQDGSEVSANIILHCTGYKYHFPFLKTNNIVTVDDNRVGPLYKHIFPPSLAPWLSFVGLPWKVVPFPLIEFQSKWIAGVLSGRISLPLLEEMMKDVEDFYSSMEASGIPKRYTHNLANCQDYESVCSGNLCVTTPEVHITCWFRTIKAVCNNDPPTFTHFFSHYEYNDWLAAECGCATYEEWRKEMYTMASKSKGIRPETYRDEWEDEHLIMQAYADFTKNFSEKGVLTRE